MKKWNGTKLTISKPSDLDEDRLRFNWGYHDGAYDEQFGIIANHRFETGHFDPIYAMGHTMGRADKSQGIYSSSSESAWIRSGLKNKHTNHKKPDKNIGPVSRLVEVKS